MRSVLDDRFSHTLQGVLRIGAGLLFLQHGVQKLFGWLGGFGGTPGATAELFSLPGVAGILELLGGALIVLGLLTRPVALVLAVEMLVAYLMAHAPQGAWPIQNGGELAMLYLLTFLFLAAAGPGRFSLDASLGLGGAGGSGASVPGRDERARRAA